MDAAQINTLRIIMMINQIFALHLPMLLNIFRALHLEILWVLINQSQIGLNVSAPQSMARYGAADIKLFCN